MTYLACKALDGVHRDVAPRTSRYLRQWTLHLQRKDGCTGKSSGPGAAAPHKALYKDTFILPYKVFSKARQGAANRFA